MQSLSDGTLLGAYTIVRLIGRGGMGEVYEAYEHSLDRRVALKVIGPQTAGANGEVDLVRRFLTEARMLAQVNHPNVVTIHAIDHVDETQFIAMEYVEGALLKDLLSLFTLSADEGSPIFVQMLEGLRALHDKGILHRDIKPHNIMLRPDGQIKILDFGIAKRVGDGNRSDTDPGKLVGTLAYLPPEVIYGARADVRSDLWSLGAIFYECLVGQPLVSLHTTKIIGVRAAADSDVLFPEECLTRVPPEMRMIIGKLCDRSPEARYATVKDALQEMKRFQQSRPPFPLYFAKALAKTVENIEEIKGSVNMDQLNDPKVKRNLALTLIQEVERIEAAEEITLGPTVPIDPEVIPLTSAVKDSVQARRKVRQRLRRDRGGWQWPTIVGLNVMTLLAAFLWFNASRLQPKVVVSAPPPMPLKIEAQLAAPIHNESLWLEANQVPTFSWMPVVGAGEYQIQIASEEDFKNPVIAEAVVGNFYRPGRIVPEGKYLWRLWPVNGQSILGPASFSISTLAPIQLLNPANNQVFEAPRGEQDGEASLNWKCKPGAHSYHVQVSLESAFKNILKEDVRTTCTWAPLALPGGTYFWRVRVEEPAQKVNSWSLKHAFLIQTKALSTVHPLARTLARKTLPPPNLPKLKQITVLKFKMTETGREVASKSGRLAASVAFNWHAVKGAQAYRLQISRSPDFKKLLTQEDVSHPNFEWKQAQAGRLFWRVASVSEGTGRYSPPSPLEVQLPAPLLSTSYAYSNGSLFEWESVPMADKYLVQWSTERKMTKPNHKLTARAQATLKVSGAPLYVRIAAANQKGERVSEFSRVTRLTTLPGK